MPTIEVWGVSDVSQAKMLRLRDAIVQACVDIPELKLSPSLVSVFIPTDRIGYGPHDVAIVRIRDVCITPERTWNVLRMLRERIGVLVCEVLQCTVEVPPIQMVPGEDVLLFKPQL